ncbi:MAG: HD domain-containing protein [Verrucomicrobia bacterium]|nr:HD domain-containing protein [Verrucomicrobiota bacterium]
MSLQTLEHSIALPPDLEEVLTSSPVFARAYLVGGAVRDSLLGSPVKDLDVEVFGQELSAITAALERFGRVDQVGRSFGVLKLTTRTGQIYDFAVPRRDSKAGPGHRGFIAEPDPGIRFEDACARRDFTINALAYDPHRKLVLDSQGGLEDLKARRLRHSSLAFVEDPLRVLRGMQIASRFELSPDPVTLELCRSIRGTFHELAKERVREEWWKWASRSRRPSIGLRFLQDCGWLDHFPQLAAMQGVEQDPEWHPEGDVFTHTLHCCDAMVGLETWRQADEETRVALLLAILLHDTGKTTTTRRETRDGRDRVVSPGHESVGAGVAEDFLRSMMTPNAMLARVPPLVANHMAHLENPSDRAIRRLACRLMPESIEALCAVMAADAMGRPPRPAVEPEVVKVLRNRSAEMQLSQSAPKPILMGKHLIPLGVTPGEAMGLLLKEAFEAQLNGVFSNLDEALAWVRERLSNVPPSNLHS